MSTVIEVTAILSVFDQYAHTAMEGLLAYEDALSHIKSVLNADTVLTFKQYNEVRDKFHELNSDRSESARNTAWKRLVDDCKFTIPQSDEPKAVEQRTKRQNERDELAALELPELEKLYQANKAADNVKGMTKYRGELDRRAKKVLEVENNELKDERKEIKQAVDKADKKTLDAIKKLLKL